VHKPRQLREERCVFVAKYPDESSRSERRVVGFFARGADGVRTDSVPRFKSTKSTAGVLRASPTGARIP